MHSTFAPHWQVLVCTKCQAWCLRAHVRTRVHQPSQWRGSLVWPLAARAQQPRIHLVGFLSGTTREGFEPNAAALREGLKEAGFIEGRNLEIEYRFADDHYDHLPALAADLIEHRVALIAADPRGVYAAQKATKTVPIVFMSGADPSEKRSGGEPQSTGWKPDRRHDPRERPQR